MKEIEITQVAANIILMILGAVCLVESEDE